MDIRTIALASTAAIVLCACGGASIFDPAPPQALTIDAAADLTGTVTPAIGGSGGFLQVGDSSAGVALVGVMGFQLGSIPAGAEIESAVLTVYHLGNLAGTGTQYSDLGDLIVDHVDLGPQVDETDFAGSLQVNIGVLSTAPGEGTRSLDVTEIVRELVAAGRARADFRIRFELMTDLDGLPDLAYLNDGGDTANNGAVPALQVSYFE